jgi:hypothetical protein
MISLHGEGTALLFRPGGIPGEYPRDITRIVQIGITKLLRCFSSAKAPANHNGNISSNKRAVLQFSTSDRPVYLSHCRRAWEFTRSR